MLKMLQAGGERRTERFESSSLSDNRFLEVGRILNFCQRCELMQQPVAQETT